MKHYTYLLLVATLILGSCTTKQKASTEEWPITPKSEEVIELLRIDSIAQATFNMHMQMYSEYDSSELNMNDSTYRKIHEYIESGIQSEMSEEAMIRRDSATKHWHSFIKLCNEENEFEAFKIYVRNSELINSIIIPREVRLDLLSFFIKPMAFTFFDTPQIACEFIEPFFLQELITCVQEHQIKGDLPYDDAHHALTEIGHIYILGEMWDKAEQHTLDILATMRLYDEELPTWGFDDTYRAEVHEAKGELSEAIEDIKIAIRKMKTVQKATAFPDALEMQLKQHEAWLVELQENLNQ